MIEFVRLGGFGPGCESSENAAKGSALLGWLTDDDGPKLVSKGVDVEDEPKFASNGFDPKLSNPTVETGLKFCVALVPLEYTGWVELETGVKLELKPLALNEGCLVIWLAPRAP